MADTKDAKPNVKKTSEKKQPADKKPKVAAKDESAKPAAQKAKSAAKSSAASNKPANKKKPSGKTVTVTQTGSAIGRKPNQRATLIGLKLNKLHRTSTLEDTPAVRGMIRKVAHLVKIEDAA